MFSLHSIRLSFHTNQNTVILSFLSLKFTLPIITRHRLCEYSASSWQLNLLLNSLSLSPLIYWREVLCCYTSARNNITISETSPSQNNPNWSTQRKYVVVTLDHPGSSDGERVRPVFQVLWAWAVKTVCMYVCLPQAYYPLLLKLDF